MPDWKPVVLAPVLSVLYWFIAYGVAGQDAPEGDTTFAWLPFLPVIAGSFWLAAASIVILIVWLDGPLWSRKWVLAAAIVATAGNLIGVVLIYGVTMLSVGVDGWPNNPRAVGALVIAGVVSLLPIAWIWRAPGLTPD
ncbi:MAG TPA: hypothetical protein VJM33_05700 [Microthrixaceae bacterium]|nr:hypothetical protein [Microthrixaceae bacterium]